MRILTNILILLLPFISMGQLVTTGQSANALVQNTLLGSGVTVSNINFNGSPAAIGRFTAFGTNLGIDEGVVITTGTIVDGVVQGKRTGPQGPNNESDGGLANGYPGYPPLSSLIGGTQTYNASILEFDFVPYSDSVSFRYVFGSEEYPEYVGSAFNDVFAFFISGPGIAGMQNMALIPGSGAPVAINSVNSGSNSNYFVSNGTGSTAPYNGSTQYIQYDGFTKVLTAESQVQCGQTYHLIIAIADAQDEIFDSGIFLEANSLTSNTPVTMTHVVAPDVFNDQDIMAEGCVTTTVTLERGPNDLASPMTIPIDLSGTAIEGVDYSNIPNSVTFPAGIQTITFSFDAFEDGLVEGLENLIITLPIIDPCGNPNPLVLELFIQDIDPVNVEITGGQIACPGDEIELIATPSGGAPPYTYLWSPGGETTQSIFVSPNSTQTYSVTVTDNCLNDSATDDYEVIVPIIPPLLLNQTADITEICPYLPALLEANASGGAPPYSYQWSSNFDPNLGTTSSITAVPSTTTTYTVVVTDNCGNVTTADIVYTILSPPLVLTMSPAVEICPGDSAFISVSAVGGYGDYFYNWLHSGETTAGVWVHPDVTSTYTVSVSDECQTFTVEGSTEVIVVKPTADFTVIHSTFFNGLPITFLNQSLNATTYEWDFGDGNTDTFIHPSNTYDEPGLYYITLVAIDDKGCTDTIVKPINIEEEWYVYIPNTFTPDGDPFNNDFRAVTIGIDHLEIIIYNRWGERVFESNDLRFVWDGTYEGRYVNDGTYTYTVFFVTNSGREKNIQGHVNVLK